MIPFTMLHPKMTTKALGLLPHLFSNGDPRQAKDQLEENYAHGGGYRPIKGFKLSIPTMTIKYPGDLRLKALAKATLHPGQENAEELYFYSSSFLCIFHRPTSQFEVVRVD